MNIASDRMKDRYDIKAVEGGYQVGDKVWLYNPQRRRRLSPKLQCHWEGPHFIHFVWLWCSTLVSKFLSRDKRL
jgi:hypothetical protein